MSGLMLVLLFWLSFTTPALGQGLERIAPGARVIRDLEYTSVGGKRLLMDVYVPAGVKAKADDAASAKGAPIVMWVHGGGWRAGDKARPPILPLLRDGLAIASINYRLVPAARFPAQIEDCRAALRYLQQRAGEMGLDGERIAVAGASAGGHLAALLGVQRGNTQGDAAGGAATRPAPRVAAMVSYFGPTDLTLVIRVRRDITPEGLQLVTDFLGPDLSNEEFARRAREASPLRHVTRSAAPSFFLHGEADPLVIVAHSRLMHDALDREGVESKLHTIPGVGHGGAAFFTEDRLRMVAQFLARHLHHELPKHEH